MAKSNIFLAGLTLIVCFSCKTGYTQPSGNPGSDIPSKEQAKSVLLQFTINRSGIIEKSEVIESSGDADIDKKALDTIQKGKLQPVPDSVAPGKEHFVVRVPIKFEFEP